MCVIIDLSAPMSFPKKFYFSFGRRKDIFFICGCHRQEENLYFVRNIEKERIRQRIIIFCSSSPPSPTTAASLYSDNKKFFSEKSKFSVHFPKKKRTNLKARQPSLADFTILSNKYFTFKQTPTLSRRLVVDTILFIYLIRQNIYKKKTTFVVGKRWYLADFDCATLSW